MERCEENQMTISAYLDGEATREEMLPVLDHLIACAECRAFYHEARQLDDLCDQLRRSCEEPAHPHPLRAFLGRLLMPPAWAWGAAAAVVIAIGMWGGGLWRPEQAVAPPATPPSLERPVRVTLGEERGAMTDDRFLELTLELLRADTRYRQEMYAVLNEVELRDLSGEEAVLLASNSPSEAHPRSQSFESHPTETHAEGERLGGAYD
jgi:hypothetical protein